MSDSRRSRDTIASSPQRLAGLVVRVHSGELPSQVRGCTSPCPAPPAASATCCSDPANHLRCPGTPARPSRTPAAHRRSSITTAHARATGPAAVQQFQQELDAVRTYPLAPIDHGGGRRAPARVKGATRRTRPAPGRPLPRTGPPLRGHLSGRGGSAVMRGTWPSWGSASRHLGSVRSPRRHR
jgi:hypothetical protein